MLIGARDLMLCPIHISSGQILMPIPYASWSFAMLMTCVPPVAHPGAFYIVIEMALLAGTFDTLRKANDGIMRTFSHLRGISHARSRRRPRLGNDR